MATTVWPAVPVAPPRKAVSVVVRGPSLADQVIVRKDTEVEDVRMVWPPPRMVRLRVLVSVLALTVT